STAEVEVLGAEANANNLKNSPSKSASQARFAHSPLVVPQTPSGERVASVASRVRDVNQTFGSSSVILHPASILLADC
ncbi:MAG: hypothetical protein ACRD1I_05930, partial [Terriglobia bacterium]